MEIEKRSADKFADLFTLGLEEISAHIAPKNQLLTSCKLHKCIEMICAEIKTYPNYHNLKNSLELLKVICSLIENLIERKDKLDKEKICVDIYKTLFCVSEAEADVVKQHIKFLCDNRMVKRISSQKKLRKWLWEVLKTFFR